jgi:hypothetical protein
VYENVIPVSANLLTPDIYVADWFPGWRAHGSSEPRPPGKSTLHISRRAGQTVKKWLNCMRACRAMDEDTGNRTRACAWSMHRASLRAWGTESRLEGGE